MVENPDHSVKYNDEGDMIYGEIEHKLICTENEMGENTLVNEKEAFNNIENDQNIADNDHEIMDRNEETNGILESTTSKMDRVQIYLDDVLFYEDENEEKATVDNRSFINTSDILSNIMSERSIPKESEINETENSNINTENNDESRNHEADRVEKNLSSNHASSKRAAHSESSNIDDPTRGGKISNTAREEVNREFEGTSPQDGPGELFNTHIILEALKAKNGPDRKLYEQDSSQINWHISNDEINNDHTEDDSQKT